MNVDGAALVEVERGDDWRYDARIPEHWQTGPEVYAGNDLDRGHLVRRRDPVWGPPDVARRANADTFRYPNAAPQQARFNQSLQLWNGLEDHVLAFARVLPNAIRLGARSDPVARQSALARAICRDHLLCFAGILAFVVLQLGAARG